MNKETKFQILFKFCSQNRIYIFFIYLVLVAEILPLWQTLRKFSFSSAVILTRSFHSSVSLTQQSKALLCLQPVFPSTFQVSAIRRWTKTEQGWYWKKKEWGRRQMDMWTSSGFERKINHVIDVDGSMQNGRNVRGPCGPWACGKTWNVEVQVKKKSYYI